MYKRQVLDVLEKLQKDEIITYKAQHNDSEIYFLVPREDDRTINRFSKKIIQQQQSKKDKIEHILAYLNNTSRCRSKLLLEYFGEAKKMDCGKCDYCAQSQTASSAVLAKIKGDIIKVINQQAISSRNLIQMLPYPEHTVLSVLQQLLEDDQLTINIRNEYQIK